MYALVIVIHVIVSVVLILVILLQAGRGGGLSESFGFSSTQTLFGTSATKFLQRATSVCAVVFLMTCLSLAALSTKRSRSLMDRVRAREAVDATAKAQKGAAASTQSVPGAAATAAPVTTANTAPGAPAATQQNSTAAQTAKPVAPVEKK